MIDSPESTEPCPMMAMSGRLVLNFDTSKADDQWEDLSVADFVAMQFTGLHDKNGKEIFEGDIVEYLDSRGKVIWNDEGAWLVEWLSHNGRSGIWELRGKYEVIGNRFEHPHLLPSI